MNWRNKYSKILRLGKEMTPEGETARRMAKKVKEKHLGGKDLRKDEIDPEMVDRMFRDLENYNYKYIPRKQIESPKMHAEYNPSKKDACPKCSIRGGKFPETLPTGRGKQRRCYYCGGTFYRLPSGQLVEWGKPVERQDSGEGENPGDYQTHAGQRILGKSGPPGLPQPTKPMGGNKPVPKPVKGTPGKPRVVNP